MNFQKEKTKTITPDKAKQVEQTSVFALLKQHGASQGKHKETWENPWWSGRLTRLQLSPLIVLLFSVGYGWDARGGGAGRWT